MKRRQLIFAAIISLMILLTLSIFRPVPDCDKDSCKSFTGTVQRIFEGGENDVVFEFKGPDRRFYINRGLEQGLELDELSQLLKDNIVTVFYPKYWTPLDPKGQLKHLAFLEFEGKILFRE